MAEQPKPNVLAPVSIPSTPKSAGPTPAVATDKEGRSLEVGDSVTLEAKVTAVHDGKVNLEVAHGDTKASLSSIHSGAVRHTGFNPRIGAAPQLRTPVVEVPAAQGGVKPVAADEHAEGRTDSTAGLPTATAKQAGGLAVAK